MQNITPLDKNLLPLRKRLGLIMVFFLISTIALSTSLFTLTTLTKSENDNSNPTVLPNVYNLSQSGAQVYASLPSDFPSVSGEVLGVDARSEIIRQYLDRYHSPLEPYADFIVEVSDNYGLDYRLTTAIAQQESNLCKKIPAGSYNCWGWGIHSRGTLGFESYEQGVETVSRGIKEKYIDKGFNTIEDIMAKYTPLSQGSWANGVNEFIDQMK